MEGKILCLITRNRVCPTYSQQIIVVTKDEAAVGLGNFTGTDVTNKMS